MPSPGDGFFPGASARGDRYANPFYGIPYKYLPQNMDHMLWWANHFLLRFGFYRSVIARISNYFITELSIECDDLDVKEQYKTALEQLQWKRKLAEGGENFIGYGNLYASVSQGFLRFLICPKCAKVTNIDKIEDYKFSNKGEFTYACPNKACKYVGKHRVQDKPLNNIEDISITMWPPREIVCYYENTTDKYEYFWRIPEDYKQKVLKEDNKFYSKHTPKAIYDALLDDKWLAFNEHTFIHAKYPSPAQIKGDGRGVPPCIYMFDDFFMLKVLQRYNEAICFEDIVPFRVIAMAEAASGGQSNPILQSQGAPLWRSAVDKMITDHRLDPGSYHTFPFTLNYQQLGGDAKNLVPADLMQQAISNILNALYVPEELYTLKLQLQAVGPALRLFENSWSPLVDMYNKLLQHWADVIGKIKGLPKAEVKLLPTTLSDDMERKSVLGQLVASNSIARSELLSLYNLDYKEQIKKKLEEDRIQREMQEEEQTKESLRQQANAGAGTDAASAQNNSTPMSVLEQAQEIAQQLFPLDGAQRRQQLQQIKAQDTTLWGAVKGALDEMSSGARSQGVQNAKQQSQQGTK